METSLLGIMQGKRPGALQGDFRMSALFFLVLLVFFLFSQDNSSRKRGISKVSCGTLSLDNDAYRIEFRNAEVALKRAIDKLGYFNEDRKETYLRWNGKFIQGGMSHAVIEGIKNEKKEDRDSLSEIVDLLGLTMEELENPADSKEIVDLLRRLETEEEEKVVQNELADKWMKGNYPNCFAMNTRALHCNFPVFRFALSPSESRPQMTKPAFVSTVAPMFLELKSLQDNNQTRETDTEYEKIFEALEQVVQRVHLMGMQNELLHRVLGFATVGCKSWIFILKRDHSKLNDRQGKLIDSYHLYPIDSSQIVSIWHTFNRKAMNDPVKMFVHAKAFLLSELLATLGYHAGFCTIQFQTTRPNIFVVTPAQLKKKHSNGDTSLSIPVSSSSNTSFVVKVSVGSEEQLRRGHQEVKILNILGDSFAADYVMATIDTGSAAAPTPFTIISFRTDFLKNNHLNINDDDLPTKKSCAFLPAKRRTTARFTNPLFSSSLKGNCSDEACDRYWWNYRMVNVQEEEYVCVIMRNAKEIVQHSDVQVNLRFLSCLQEIHKKNVLHCDLRIWNLMDFGDNYYIVDFDVAVHLEGKESFDIDLRQAAGQKQFMVAKMGVKQDAISVEWNQEKDLVMLMATLKGLPDAAQFKALKKENEEIEVTMER
jgi:hypothetical protein